MPTDKFENIDIKKRNGFSFVEVLVAILITGIVITASIPVLTQMSKNLTGQDKNAIDCINANAVDVVQNATSGAITQPTAYSSCGGAIASCKNGSCDSLKYLADNGNATQQAAARKVLRASCDIGGEEACDYFIYRCKSNAAYCNDTSLNDLAFYLDKSTTTQSIVGVQVISNALLKLYDTFDSAFNANLLNQFKNYACPTNINSIGCNIFLNHMRPLIINKCNQGDASYCSFAYTYNLNRSCNQIKQSWNGAIDGPYTITTSTSANYRTNCDMTTDDGGWTQVAAVYGGLPVIASYYTNGYGTPLTGSSWIIPSNKFDTFSAPVMRLNMGTSRAYFRPSGASLFSQMVVSHTLHKWANNWEDPFVYPLYYSAHLGGAQRYWTSFSGQPYGNNAPNIAGAYLNFWGANNVSTGGGYSPNTWSHSFTMWVKETSGQVTGADCNNLQAKFTSPADAPSGKYVLDNGTTAYCAMNRHRSCAEWYNANTKDVTPNSDPSNATEYRTNGTYWINPTRTTGAQQAVNCTMNKTSCLDWYNDGAHSNGNYMVNGSLVACDMSTFLTKYDCRLWYNAGYRTNGIYTIKPTGSEEYYYPVYCDMTTDGGGWTVIQRRVNGSVDFHRNWSDYKNGFGDLNGSFYIGNHLIYKISNNVSPTLRIDMTYGGSSYYAKYSQFRVQPENMNYQLIIGGYSGTAGDSMFSSVQTTNGMYFSTFDRDNDKYSGNCASMYSGGWWFNACHSSNINGHYNWTAYANGVTWWTLTGDNSSLSFVEMKLR